MKFIVYFRHFPPPIDGGAFYYNYHLVDEFLKDGHTLTVFTHKLAGEIDHPNIKFIKSKFVKIGREDYKSGISKLISTIRIIFQLRTTLIEEDYDYIISDAGYLQNLIVHIANIGIGKRVVGINHGEEVSIIQKTTGFRAYLQRELLNKNIINVCNSYNTKTILDNLRISSKKIVVHPCIEAQPSLISKSDAKLQLIHKYNLSENDLLVGYVGRHVFRKGIQNLIKATDQCILSGNNVTLLLGGKGTYTDELKKLVIKKELSEKVLFLGELSWEEKQVFLRGIDIFAMPNFYDGKTGDIEGFGIVFLEAAANGTVVIGGKAGGSVEAISDGYNGILVDGTNIENITDAIVGYKNLMKLRRHSENGIDWAHKFFWKNEVKPLLDLLKS